MISFKINLADGHKNSLLGWRNFDPVTKLEDSTVYTLQNSLSVVVARVSIREFKKSTTEGFLNHASLVLSLIMWYDWFNVYKKRIGKLSANICLVLQAQKITLGKNALFCHVKNVMSQGFKHIYRPVSLSVKKKRCR